MSKQNNGEPIGNLSAKERREIKTYAERWIGQFEGSHLIEIHFLTAYLPLGEMQIKIEDQIHIEMHFQVPIHSQGSVFVVSVRASDLHAFDMVATALWQQEQVYKELPIHNGLKFTPMEQS